jgi:serine/threonine protein kinase
VAFPQGGRPPFVGESWQATVMQVIHDDPVPPTRLRPDVPTELESICLKCLEKEPAHRYASAGELAEDLRRFLAGESLAVVPVSEPERQVRWAREAGFEIQDVLTFGVRDVVYKARQVHLNRIVALKVIAAPAQVEPAARERLVHEAKTLALLDHPNIVRIYSSGEMHGRAYLAFEYVAGGSLIERFVDQPLPPFKAARLVWQLAEALHYAHQHDVLHCALKPSNILLTADGVPKISNFGLSILLEQPESERRLAFRRLPSYMAPELADGRMADVGRATDIYSLGAVLYKLLTGEPPFLVETLAETLEQVRSSPPRLPSRFQPEVPAALEAICLRCLEKEPTRRYTSADELARDLDSCLTRMQTRTDEVELLPGYELLEELGRGGTGIVHKARQLSLNRLVALKIFYESRARFLVANQAVARLHHPNILDIYDSGERDGRLYVAEELIEGKTLDRQIGGKPLPPASAARLIETLARAMHHAHEHGIIHRNLKPRVVLLTALGIPKISSFDLALLRNEPLPEQEPPGTLVGTPAYMAPEQTLGDAAQIQPATDVYALGLILYEMLIGKPAFVGADALELLHQVQTRPAPSPRLERPSISRDLDAICLKCLAKAPRERYGTAQALAEDLRRFREGMPTEARPVPFGERVVYWVRRQFARAGEKA